MSFDLIIEQPWWFILICLLLGAIYSLVLYAKGLRKSEGRMPRGASVSLAVFRFLGVSLLAILLLNPLLKYLERLVEKPAIFLAIDNSESLRLGGDSTYVLKNLDADLEKFKSGLSTKYDVIELDQSTGKRTFESKETDLSQYFTEMTKLYGGRNAAGMVLISDGIYNQGLSPGFAAQRSNVPVFTIPLGDTTIRRDVGIYSTKANAITFLGNKFPIEVVVNATKASNQQVELSLWQKGKKVDSKAITIQGKRFSTSHTFIVEAKKVGLQDFTVRVSTLDGELNTANNVKRVYTEVLDARQKILVLAHAPHPDVATIRMALESKDQYEMTLEIGNFSPIKKSAYDLIITHQLPASPVEYNLMQDIRKNEIPVFSFIGTSTNIDLFNRFDNGVQIVGNRSNFNQALSSYNKQFVLFQPDDELGDFIASVPPLTVPFGEYSKVNSGDVLIQQKIGSVKTDLPLWFFNTTGESRSGVCFGEGIWRWRLHDFERNETHDHVVDILQKTIQYLALKDDKRKFRVYTSSRSFFENERINFIAEVYNESYEFTADAEVKVSVEHEDGATYSYDLLPGSASYTYAIGSLPPGNYIFQATAQRNGKNEKVSGNFTVKELQLERLNLTANYGLLNQIASETGGATFYKTQWEDLSSTLLALPNSASVAKTNHRYRDLISQKWLFFVLVLLLSLEWFARRWFGGY